MAGPVIVRYGSGVFDCPPSKNWSAPDDSRPPPSEYYRRMLSDPATGEIPPGIRARELDAARYRNALVAAKQGGGSYFDWSEAAPPQVGGRTRALAVDVGNPDVILVSFSNYNLAGLYHSNDGGQNYTLVEGTLEGSPNAPGPSIRSATIVPVGEDTFYPVGTSTGVYSTAHLDGSRTVWHPECAESMGHVVVTQITSRPSDGWVVAGTHGRGAFQAVRSSTPVSSEREIAIPDTPIIVEGYPNPFDEAATIRFVLPGSGPVRLEMYDALGKQVATIVNGGLPAGTHSVRWEPDPSLPSGIYAVHLSTPTGTASHSILRVRQH